jgi:DNA-binding beta-propeller fold protein YncE
MPRPLVRRFTVLAAATRRLITARSAAAACGLAVLLPALAPAATPAVTAAAPGVKAAAPAVTARRTAPVAYVANVVSGTISRIRLASGRAEPPVRLGRRSGPWAIAVAPGGRTIWVANAGNGTVTPISTRTGRAGRPAKVPAQPTELAVAPNGKTVWVVSQINGTNQTPGRITPISTATGRAGKPIRVGIDPGPLVISPDSRTVYLATSGLNNQTLLGNITVISARTDRVRRILHAGEPNDMTLAPGGRTLYVAIAGPPAAVIPVQTASLRRGRPIRLPEFPLQMIMGSGGRSIYVLGASGLVTRISAHTDRVAWSVHSGAPTPASIGLTPDGRLLYVLEDAPHRRRGYLKPIGATSGVPYPRIMVGHDPLAIAFGPSGRTAYVLCSPTWVKGNNLEFGIGSVFGVSVATGRVGKPVLTGRGSLSLAVVPGRSYEPVGAGPEK